MSDKRKRERDWNDNETSTALTPSEVAAAGYGLPDDWLKGIQTAGSEGKDVIPDGAIVPQQDGTWAAGNVQLTSVGLSVHGDFSDDQWLQIGAFLQRMQGSLQWLIGDWVVGCHQLWGDTYEKVVEATGYEYATVADYAYVARNVPLSVRTDKLKFGHYKLLAALSVDEQSHWVTQAVENAWSIAALRKAINPPTLLGVGTPNKKIRQKFNKIWRNSSNIDAISLDDIDVLRKWLDAMERMKRG